MKFFKDKYRSSLIVLSIIFFVIYSFLNIDFANFPKLNFTSSDYLIFNQPDESANYFFSRNLTFSNHYFRVPEELSFLTLNQLHPRSMTVVEGNLVPIGFPGVILVFSLFASLFVAIFGGGVFNFALVSFVPLLGALTPLVFYAFLKKIFNRRVAFLASLLLFINPAWWYYSSRSLQHIIVFSFFLVSSLYFVAKFVYCHNFKKKNIFAFLWAFLFGLAVIVRPIEVLWLGPVFLFFLIYLRKNFNPKDFLFFGLGAFLTAFVFFFLQIVYYGAPLATGYALVQENGMAGSVLDKVNDSFFLFGFSFKAILKNAWHYAGILFPAWFLSYAFSFVYLVYLLCKKNLDKKKYLILFNIFIFIALVLSFYYGSSSFADNLSGNYSIGSSQVRYFMPLYIFGTLFIAIFFDFLLKLQKLKYLLLPLFFIILSLSSVFSVFYKFESLTHIKSVLKEYKNIRTEIVEKTENNAIIITRYADKYLFPERQVITSLENDYFLQGVKILVSRGYPVYIFDLLKNEKALETMLDRLSPYDLGLSEPVYENEDSQLRQILSK